MADKISSFNIPINDNGTTTQTIFEFKDVSAVNAFSYDTSSKKFQRTINSTTEDVVSCDTTPTQNSTNPITSGGVYSSLGIINATLESLL